MRNQPCGRAKDDDGFYYGSVTADLLRQHGCGVVHMTAGDTLATFTQNNLAYPHIRKRMVELGIEALVSHMAPRIACLDYSAGRREPLVAYRWDGEENLDDKHFVTSE